MVLQLLMVCVVAGQPCGEPLVCEHCDMIEVNHVFDCRDSISPAPTYTWTVQKRYRLSAVLFWHADDNGEYQIKDWRFFWKCGPPGPTADGKWCVEWEDRGCIRRVTADHYIETWTPFDVEVECRHRGRRPGLKQIPVVQQEQ